MTTGICDLGNVDIVRADRIHRMQRKAWQRCPLILPAITTGHGKIHAGLRLTQFKQMLIADQQNICPRACLCIIQQFCDQLWADAARFARNNANAWFHAKLLLVVSVLWRT